MDELLTEWSEKFEDIDADIDILKKEIDNEKCKGEFADFDKLNHMNRFLMMLEVWNNQFNHFLHNL